MSRFSRALAAASMAIAAAGGGLLIAAAGAVPAYAAAPAAPHGAHTITTTAHRPARAASGIGPHDVLPCAKKPGVAPASCGDGDVVSCTLSAGRPYVNFPTREVRANAIVQCTDEVASVTLTEHLLQGGVSVATDTDPEVNSPVAITSVATACELGTYINVVDATITPKWGYVLSGPSTRHFESVPFQVLPTGCISGGGGGGGCAIHAPSVVSHPAGRHPDFVSCG